MLFELKTVQDLKLKEIDDIIEEIASCGYGGVVLPRDGDWEIYRGFCRSAGRYGLKLWLRDDMDDPSGSFGGEVTSVPSFCSDKPELWGCAPYSSEAAEAFLDCSYMEMKRELGRFMGYELTGIVTRFGKADDAFAKTHLRPISEFCQNNGLDLIAQTDFPASYGDTKTAFTDLTDKSLAERQRELCALYAKGMKRMTATTGLYPDFIEAAWCTAADRLAELLPDEPEAAQIGAKFRNGAYLLYNDGSEDKALTLNLEISGAKYIADSFTGAVYLPKSPELTVTIKEGGSLVLLPEAEEAEPLPPFLSCGAVFEEFTQSEELPVSLLGYDENRLPLKLENGRCTFEVKHVSSGIRLEIDSATYVRLNGRELTGTCLNDPDKIFIPDSTLHLGDNLLETDGTEPVLCGSIYTNGEALLPPVKPELGNVREQGMACYDGPIAYLAELPQDCRGKYLHLDGNFSCAFVKIGRRRQSLLLPPFMLPLFSTDEGRSAEITIFPANAQKNVPFGLNSVNIVSVKN